MLELLADVGLPNALLFLMYIPLGYTWNVKMARSTVFMTNRSQAVRLPKSVAFPADVREVEIIKIGNSRVVSPIGRRWDDLFDSELRASDDFMSDRQQPAADQREQF
jgi:antitoxin VapB